MFPEHLLEEVSNADMRLDYCECCGSTPGVYETHHIKSKGSGGPDIRANKINLCAICHKKAQEYKIKPQELIIAIARREKVKIAEIYQAIGWPVPDDMDELEGTLQSEEPSQTIEDLIALLIQAEQGEQDSKFLRGEIIDVLVKRGVKKSWIASQIGKSSSYVRSLHKTYLAFPDESMRVPTLSFSHHKIVALTTDDPAYWIERAAGKNENGEETGQEMSTRELRNAILESDHVAGKIPIECDEEKTMRRAQKALNEINEVIAIGGTSKEWLIRELSAVLKDYQSIGIAS